MGPRIVYTKVVNDGAQKLLDDINSRIDYWRKEASLTYIEAVGVVEIVKAGLIQEMLENEE